MSTTQNVSTVRFTNPLVTSDTPGTPIFIPQLPFTNTKKLPPQCSSESDISGLMIFIIIISLISFIWILFYVFNPFFVQEIEKGETKAADGAPPNRSKAFIYSLGFTVLILLIVWVYQSCKC